MSYLSLLLPTATQGMASEPRMGRETEAEIHAASDALEGTWTGRGSETSDYQLPLGIASLQHWLDLNA